MGRWWDRGPSPDRSFAPLTLSCGANRDARGGRLGGAGFVERSFEPSSVWWSGGNVNGGLESPQLGGKNESASRVIPETMRLGTGRFCCGTAPLGSVWC